MGDLRDCKNSENDNERIKLQLVPVARLAFNVSTEKGAIFVRNLRPRAAYEANAIMDWVSDAPLKKLLLRLRGLINAHGQEYVC